MCDVEMPYSQISEYMSMNVLFQDIFITSRVVELATNTTNMMKIT